MAYRIRLAQLLVVTALIPLRAAAQAGPARWEQVQAIPSSSNIHVVATNSPASIGKLESVTDNGLVIVLDSGPQTIGRDQIVKISVKKPGHRGRNTLIGFGVGLAAGLGAGAATTSGSSGWQPISRGEAVGILGGVGGILGAIVGAVWPTGGWHTVYQR